MLRRITLLLWTLFALYPNPSMLYVSARRAYAPPVDAAAVQRIAATLPDDPQAIEEAVNTRLLPYAVPWQTYGVPWYFPSVAEILEKGEGDCEARALLFASILTAKGIPAKFVGSFDHLWVEYPHKRPNALENPAVAIAAQEPDGSYRLRLPRLVDWQKSWEIERSYFWDAMPAWRAWLLLVGWLLLGVWGRRRKSVVRLAGSPAPAIVITQLDGSQIQAVPVED